MWSSVEAVGIWATDIHVLDGDFAPTVFRSLGHEISGVVEVVRDNVTVRRQTWSTPGYCRRVCAKNCSRRR
jgi:D-arabinose 1-dehydrogenase-like Zn-dependent alcohol dehydrogenase